MPVALKTSTLLQLREARDRAEVGDTSTALLHLIDALIADRMHESAPAPSQAVHHAGRLDVLHQLRTWHESQAADCYGGANDAHTASIAEIDRLIVSERPKI